MDKKNLLQGIDRIDFDLLKNKKVALITNHTAVNRYGVPTVKILLENGIDVVMIFSLEHGYFPIAQDMEAVEEDPRILNIPLYSLYGENATSLEPELSSFEMFDTVVFDVQDIGSRYYTYVQSLTIFMDFIEANPKELIILDRVNPINGVE